MKNKRIMIKDGTNFYKGKVGTVVEENVIAGVKVLWVEVGNVGMAIREDAVEYI